MDAGNPKDGAAPEGTSTSDDRQQPEVSNSTTAVNATDEESFPAWDGGDYRARPELPVKGGSQPTQSNKGTNTNDPKTVKDDKKKTGCVIS